MSKRKREQFNFCRRVRSFTAEETIDKWHIKNIKGKNNVITNIVAVFEYTANKNQRAYCFDHNIKSDEICFFRSDSLGENSNDFLFTLQMYFTSLQFHVFVEEVSRYHAWLLRKPNVKDIERVEILHETADEALLVHLGVMIIKKKNKKGEEQVKSCVHTLSVFKRKKESLLSLNLTDEEIDHLPIEEIDARRNEIMKETLLKIPDTVVMQSVYLDLMFFNEVLPTLNDKILRRLNIRL